MSIKRLVVIFFMGFCELYAQDTINFVNKQVLAAKVDEVGTNEIHYHRYDNLSGPLYVAKKENIRSIKYSNGQIDTFRVLPKKVETISNETFTVYNPNSTSDKIVIYHKKLFYHQRAIGEKPLLQLISSCPNQQRKTIMLKEYLNMKNFQRRQYLFGFGGAAAGGALFLAGLSTSNVNTSALCILTAIPVVIAGQIISGVNKHNRLKKKMEIAQIYNQ